MMVKQTTIWALTPKTNWYHIYYLFSLSGLFEIKKKDDFEGLCASNVARNSSRPPQKTRQLKPDISRFLSYTIVVYIWTKTFPRCAARLKTHKHKQLGAFGDTAFLHYRYALIIPLGEKQKQRNFWVQIEPLLSLCIRLSLLSPQQGLGGAEGGRVVLQSTRGTGVLLRSRCNARKNASNRAPLPCGRKGGEGRKEKRSRLDD